MQKILSIEDEYSYERCESLLGIPRYFINIDDTIDA